MNGDCGLTVMTSDCGSLKEGSTPSSRPEHKCSTLLILKGRKSNESVLGENLDKGKIRF